MNGLHHALAAALGFGVGASVGSFLNVCAWRLPRGESLVRPPSRCPRCGVAILARDNLPVLGWVLLRGRCRHCAGPIPARYPLVEAATGSLFAAVVLGEALTGPLDLVDRGLWVVAARVGCQWSLVALLVTATLIEHDRRRSGIVPPCARPGWRALTVAVALVAACLAVDPAVAAWNLAPLAVFLVRSVPPGAGRSCGAARSGG